MSKICGYEQCCTSTGIHGGLTHGWGRLDNNGFWAQECPEADGKHVASDNEVYRALGQPEFIREEEMTFDQAWTSYNSQRVFSIDTRGSLATLRRGFIVLGRFHTFAQALGAYVQEVKG